MKTKTPPSSSSEAHPVIVTNDDAKERMAALLRDNIAARETLQHICANPDRWKKLNQQAANQQISAIEFDALCGKMLRTRREWTHLTTPQGREIAAFHGLLIALGSAPSEADEAALNNALSGSSEAPVS